MNEFENARKRGLQKAQNGTTFRRIISIEQDGMEFSVKIADLRMTGSYHGLLDPNDRNAPTSTVAPTAKITPSMPLKDAVEFANGEFRRSIEHERFKPLSVGEECC